MHWIVRKDNPKPETYIPIFVCRHLDRKKYGDIDKYRDFNSENDAISFAKSLLSKFNAQSIRFFYQEGHSEKLR